MGVPRNQVMVIIHDLVKQPWWRLGMPHDPPNPPRPFQFHSPSGRNLLVAPGGTCEIFVGVYGWKEYGTIMGNIMGNDGNLVVPSLQSIAICQCDMGMGQNPIPLVNIKIAGKWMFIPLKMVLIGIDPYPYGEWINRHFLGPKLGETPCSPWKKRLQ